MIVLDLLEITDQTHFPSKALLSSSVQYLYDV